MGIEPPGTGKPKPARGEVKIHPPVQLTGIRGGKRMRGRRDGQALVAIYPTTVSTTARSSSSLQLKTSKAFPPGSILAQYVFRKLQGSLKKQSLSSMKLCPCPTEQAPATHLNQEECVCTQQAEYREKKKILLSPLHQYSSSQGKGMGCWESCPH